MDRGYRNVGRASLLGPDYDDYRGYSRQGGSSYADRDPSLRESYLGSSSSGYRAGRSSNYDLVETILQQRALQQQLSLRESQLALANTLLQQQQQQQQFLNKRRMDPRGGDPRMDFKRPRMMDNRARPRSRLPGGRDLGAGGRGPNFRRNQGPPRGRGHSSSDRPQGSRDSHDPEKPITDEDAVEKSDGKFRCKPCGAAGESEEDLKKHLSSSQHKDKVVGALSGKDADGKGGHTDRKGRGYCNICDVPLNVTLLHHQRLTFHKKRKVQVTKGCGWCSVTSFKNFSEVLEHRDTEKHLKNQKMYDRRNKNWRSDNKSRSDFHSRPQKREREPIKVELPPELAKFDPKVVTGQTCVISVTGWFCKLCNKFYNNETAAKETHCMTEAHFNNYKKFMYTKLKAKAEAERDAREKAAAEEEEQKRKEEEAKMKEEEGRAEPTSEEAEGEEEAAEAEQENEEEMETGAAEDEEGEEEEAGMEEEDAGLGEEEGGAEEEEEEGGEEIMEEPESEYVDDEEVAALEENLFEQTREEGEEETGAVDAENVEGHAQEEEEPAMQKEEPIEAEGVGGEVVEEEAEESEKKATRASVNSPGRGRGRARRARKMAR